MMRGLKPPVILCSIDGCPWELIPDHVPTPQQEIPLPVEPQLADITRAVYLIRATEINRIIKAHLEVHTVEDFARQIHELRQRLACYESEPPYVGPGREKIERDR